MLTRTLTASVLPRNGRLRAALPNLRAVRLQLDRSRRRSLRMQERADGVRARCTERHGYGRRS